MANRNINSPYSASITGCGFMYEEMRALLPMLMSPDRDSLLKEELLKGEHLMMSSERARSRAIPEFVKRYNAVPKSFWNWFLALNDKSQRVKFTPRPTGKKYHSFLAFHILITPCL